MKFIDFLTVTFCALIVILCGLPELMHIRAIASEDFTIIWFLVLGGIYLFVWFYFLNKAKNNLKKQIIVFIAGMVLFTVILILVCQT